MGSALSAAFCRCGFRVVAVALLALMIACDSGKNPSPSPSLSQAAARLKPIELIVPDAVSTLDPRYSTRSLDIKVTRLVHAGLVGLHPDTLEPIPWLARSWEWVGPMTLRVHLRPGLVFHSGKPLTPEDVCATFDALNDPAVASPHRAVVRAIGSCRGLGPDALEISLSEPRATLLTDLEVPILRADQARLPPRSDGNLDGLGPYRIASTEFGRVLLEPADTGLLPRPKSRVAVHTVRDANARALRLLAGRADIAPNGISPELLHEFEGRDDLIVRARPGANVTYLIYQNDRPPFNRADVRHAVAQAIDREQIVESLFSGRAQLASWVFPRGHWSHPEGLAPEPYAPERVKPILQSLPPVTLLTSTDRFRVLVARAIAQMLGDAGLSVRVVSLDLGVLLQRLDAGDFELALLQMPELTEPNILKWFFHPSGVPGEGGEGRNRARYRSPRAGALLDEGAAKVDLLARQRAYAELARLMAQDLPILPLWHEPQVAVVSARAAEFMPSAEGRWISVAKLP